MRVEARGAARRFGRVEALRGVSFDVPAGRRVALVGPNGSGKSTLNRIVMGLIACEGSVRVDGRSPLHERVRIARRMAYVPQAPPQTAAAVGEIASAVCRVRGIAAEALEKVAARLELDLAGSARTPFRALSGGTKQKLLIALALAADASLLVLDEPTGSLDAATRERFFELFAALPSDATLLLCSHRLEEIVPLVDHVLALEEGRIVYDGAADAFLDARALSVIEVRATGDAAAAWLEANGFRRGAGGWWLRSVSRGEKPERVAAVLDALGGALHDISVRELDALELPEAPAGGGERH